MSETSKSNDAAREEACDLQAAIYRIRTNACRICEFRMSDGFPLEDHQADCPARNVAGLLREARPYVVEADGLAARIDAALAGGRT